MNLTVLPLECLGDHAFDLVRFSFGAFFTSRSCLPWCFWWIFLRTMTSFVKAFLQRVRRASLCLENKLGSVPYPIMILSMPLLFTSNSFSSFNWRKDYFVHWSNYSVSLSFSILQIRFFESKPLIRSSSERTKEEAQVCTSLVPNCAECYSSLIFLHWSLIYYISFLYCLIITSCFATLFSHFKADTEANIIASYAALLIGCIVRNHSKNRSKTLSTNHILPSQFRSASPHT